MIIVECESVNRLRDMKSLLSNADVGCCYKIVSVFTADLFPFPAKRAPALSDFFLDGFFQGRARFPPILVPAITQASLGLFGLRNWRFPSSRLLLSPYKATFLPQPLPSSGVFNHPLLFHNGQQFRECFSPTNQKVSFHLWGPFPQDFCSYTNKFPLHPS